MAVAQPPAPDPPLPRSYYALKPDIKVIAPWREWDLNSRTSMVAYAEANGIPVPAAKRGEAPYSMDANLLHISYEGNALEDPWVEPQESMFTRSVSPEQVRGLEGGKGGWQRGGRLLSASSCRARWSPTARIP